MLEVADWPFPAKAVGAAFGVLVVAALWSAGAGAVLLLELGRLDTLTHALSAWWHYHAFYPSPRATASANARVVRGLRDGALAASAVPALLLGAFAIRAMAPQLAHDGARWANWRDLRRVGFSSRHGLYFGRVGGRFLRLGRRGPRKHIALYASTQSGKGVGFVIPAGLCDASEQLSFVWFDPKFEAFLATSGWQAEIGANVILFAPLHPLGQTAQYNPCAYVRRKENGSPTVDTWGDIEDIVHAQIPQVEGPQGFWNREARKAYVAILAYLSETPGATFTIPEAIRLMKRPSAPAEMRTRIDAARKAGRPYSEPCVRELSGFLSGNADLLEGINRTINSYLGIFSNPRVVAAVSGNTFDLTRLNKERTALYIGVAPNEIAKLLPLLQLLFQQMVDLNVRTPPGTDPAVQFEVNVILDEFVLLKAMDKIKDAFGYIAGWGFRLIAIFQSRGQLDGVYGKDGAKAIMDNCKIEIAIAVDDLDQQKAISAKLGTTKGVRRGASGSALDFFKRNSSTSAMERPLVSPYGVGNLPDTQAIVLHGGIPGALVKRLRYYEQAPFKHRLRPPVVVPAIEIDLSLDDGSYFGSPDAPAQGVHRAPPAPVPPPDDPDDPGPGAAPAGLALTPARRQAKGSRGASSPSPVVSAPSPSLTVFQAEAVLTAATGGAVDLSAFAQSPDAARAQIDRVLLHLPTPKALRKGRKKP